jgi:hypothetical protein
VSQQTASAAPRHHPFGVMPRRRDGRTLRGVTQLNTQPADAATGHAPPIIAVLAGAFLVLCTVLPLMIVARSALRARRRLRGCPVCGDRAVRDCGRERVNYFEAMVMVQCGQCATWRRLVVNQTDAHAHSRRLERDRRRIQRVTSRLEASRRKLDMQAFIVLLRSDVAGAEDFLAVTCSPAPPVRDRRRPSGG